MPDKIITQSVDYVGLVGAVLAAVSSLLAAQIKFKADKADKNAVALERSRAENEKQYRTMIREQIDAAWKRIDEAREDITELQKNAACIQGRFEDLQRAHFEATCKRMKHDDN